MCRLSVDVYLPCPEGLCSHNSDLICTSGESTHTHTHTLSAHATNHPFKPSFIWPSPNPSIQPTFPLFNLSSPLYRRIPSILQFLLPLRHPAEIQLASSPSLFLLSPLSPFTHLPSVAVGFNGLLKVETDAKYFRLKLLTADILCWYSIAFELANFTAQNIYNIQKIVQRPGGW